MHVDRKEIALGTAVASGATLAMLLMALFSGGDFNQRLYAVVGRPFGLPSPVYVGLVMVAIWLPLPVWFWHLQLTRRYARTDPSRVEIQGSARVVGLWALLQYISFLLKLRGEPRRVQRAKIIALAGVLYGIGVIAWWITWTSSHGI
jgi:hypothetical protein